MTDARKGHSKNKTIFNDSAIRSFLLRPCDLTVGCVRATEIREEGKYADEVG
eukprot:evm.model.NODE_31971_length_20727_cov_40.271866.6